MPATLPHIALPSAWSRRSLLLSLALLPGILWGAQAPLASLTIRPSICVSYNSEEPCRMAMEISWQSDVNADVCLMQNGSETPLRCWEQIRGATLQVNYANSQDVAYQLIDQNSKLVIAEADIKVINRDLRSSRKRRRHVWSIL